MCLAPMADEIERRLTQRAQREFVWLKRRLHPDLAAQIDALQIAGCFSPEGIQAVSILPVRLPLMSSASPISMTSDRKDWNWPTTTGCRASQAFKRVIRDRLGRTVEHAEFDPGL